MQGGGNVRALPLRWNVELSAVRHGDAVPATADRDDVLWAREVGPLPLLHWSIPLSNLMDV